LASLFLVHSGQRGHHLAWHQHSSQSHLLAGEIFHDLVTSDPPLGSVTASAEIFLPDGISGSTRALNADLPARAIGGAPIELLFRAGAHTAGAGPRQFLHRHDLHELRETRDSSCSAHGLMTLRLDVRPERGLFGSAIRASPV
jgi:hypothetical protein